MPQPHKTTHTHHKAAPKKAEPKVEPKAEAKPEPKSNISDGEREAVETLIAFHEREIEDLKERLS